MRFGVPKSFSTVVELSLLMIVGMLDPQVALANPNRNLSRPTATPAPLATPVVIQSPRPSPTPRGTNVTQRPPSQPQHSSTNNTSVTNTSTTNNTTQPNTAPTGAPPAPVAPPPYQTVLSGDEQIRVNTNKSQADQCISSKNAYRDSVKEYNKACNKFQMNVPGKCDEALTGCENSDSLSNIFSTDTRTTKVKIDPTDRCQLIYFGAGKDFYNTAYDRARDDVDKYQGRLEDAQQRLLQQNRDDLERMQDFSKQRMQNYQELQKAAAETERSNLANIQATRAMAIKMTGEMTKMAVAAKTSFDKTVLAARNERQRAILMIRAECMAQAKVMLKDYQDRIAAKRATRTYNRSLTSMLYEGNVGRSEAYRRIFENEKNICLKGSEMKERLDDVQKSYDNAVESARKDLDTTQAEINAKNAELKDLIMRGGENQQQMFKDFLQAQDNAQKTDAMLQQQMQQSQQLATQQSQALNRQMSELGNMLAMANQQAEMAEGNAQMASKIPSNLSELSASAGSSFLDKEAADLQRKDDCCGLNDPSFTTGLGCSSSPSTRSTIPAQNPTPRSTYVPDAYGDGAN